jgi:hypothetical protein
MSKVEFYQNFWLSKGCTQCDTIMIQLAGYQYLCQKEINLYDFKLEISWIPFYPWKWPFLCLSMWQSMILDSSHRMICRRRLNIGICKLYHTVWILELTYIFQYIYLKIFQRKHNITQYTRDVRKVHILLHFFCITIHTLYKFCQQIYTYLENTFIKNYWSVTYVCILTVIIYNIYTSSWSTLTTSTASN